MPVFLWLLGAAALVAAPTTVAAQWPGEIQGRVIDEVTGSPVTWPDLVLLPVAIHSVGDSGGRFRLHGLAPGTYTLSVSALGFSTTTLEVDVRDGVVRDVTVALSPVAIPIEGVTASVDAVPVGAITLGAEHIRALPANTVADVLRTVSGVLIATTSPGGPETPSIRGSATDAVLVLVDGVPLNDPVTGAADLSIVPSAGVASVTVLVGAHSARYGARATGGVILIRSGSPERGASAAAGVGSLESWEGEAVASKRAGSGRLDAVATYRGEGGSFAFDQAPEVGGGTGQVTNADSRRWSGRLSWTTGGDVPSGTVGGSVERVERGLPGRSFAPSPSARQTLTQARVFGTATHRTREGRGVSRFAAYTHYYDSRFNDSAPPFGLPFDDETTLIGGGADVGHSEAIGFGTIGGGADARLASVESSALAETDGYDRADLGAWLSASIPDGPVGTSWTATFRLDRSSLPASWFASHDIGLRFDVGRLRLAAGHRSSFSPPTLGDQFFREGVGVEPNPDLEAERVPSEWVGGIGTDVSLGRALLSADAEIYDGDVDGMILWQPDFRFVWSPRNHDVSRRGLDVRTRVRLPHLGVEMWADGSIHRTTYDRQDSDDVQVAYRPRYLVSLGGSLSHAAWSLLVQTRYTGARFPVPNAVNELPGYWGTDVAARRSWQVGATRLGIQAEIERLFDQNDALIFAFPHPGRTIRLTLRIGAQASS